jgi:hypothetical protein
MRVFSERPILFNAEMVRAILAGTKTQTRRPMQPQPTDIGVPGSYLDSYCSEPKTAANPRGMSTEWRWWTADHRPGTGGHRCPYGVPGDRLWVRERARVASVIEAPLDGGRAEKVLLRYEADGAFSGWLPYPARLARLPVGQCVANGCYREASRLTLEVTAVRVERLLSISESDVRAEGVKIYVTDEGCPPGKVSPAIRITGKHAPSDYMPADQASWTEADYYRGEYLALWDDIYGRTAPSKSSPWVWAIEFRRVEVSDGR